MKNVRAAVLAAFVGVAGCAGAGSMNVPGSGSCLFSGLTQMVYPVPGATSVPDTSLKIVFATSQLFPSGFDVLVNSDPNPANAGAGAAAFFQQISQSQVPQPSASPTISNPFYESASFGSTFPHATYYVFLNDSRVSCTPTSAGSFTTQ